MKLVIDPRADDPPEHALSNYAAAKTALLDAIAIPPANVHRIRGEETEPSKAAEAYEAVLRETIKVKVAGLPVLDVVVRHLSPSRTSPPSTPSARSTP